MFETRNKALGGSRTADNLSDVEDMKGFDGNLLMNLLTGRWGQATAQGAQVIGRTASGQNEATRELIARALLSRDPQAALGPALQQALTSDQRQRVLEAIVRSGGIRLGHVGP